MELSIFNLRRFYQNCKGEDVSFHLLVEYFGVQVWDYDILFGSEIEGVEPDPEIRVINTLNLEMLEKQAVLRALEVSNYVQCKAAKLLGISLRALNYRIKNGDIRHPNWIVNN